MIKNSYLNTKTLLEPIAFASLAALAGTSRFIRYFPGASKEGLFMAAGFASVASYLYDRTLHDPDHSYFRTLLGKTLAIALGTFSAGLGAASLAGRVSLSFLAAAKLGALEFAASAIIQKIVQETPLQKQHRGYSCKPKTWICLTTEERSKLINAFYEAGLPAISFIGAPADCLPDCFDEPNIFQEKINSYTAAQLSWYRELFQTEMLCNEPDQDKLSSFFEFNKRLQALGLPLLKWNMGADVVEFLRNSPENKEMVYQEFANIPVYRWFCEGDFEELFKDKPRLPTLEEAAQQLKDSEIETMPPEILLMWHAIFHHDLHPWNSLSEAVRSAFLKCFIIYDTPVINACIDVPGDISWINTLTAEEIEGFSDNQSGWFISLFLDFYYTTEGIPAKSVRAFNKKLSIKLSYYLTPEAVSLAEQDREFLEELIKQFSSFRHRGEDYGFLNLSSQNQMKLRALFRSQPTLLPYKITEELVERAGLDTSLINHLKGQFYNAYGNDYGFFDLSKGIQEKLRTLLDECACYLPYNITPELIKIAESDLKLIKNLKNQFTNNNECRFFGFYDLSAEQQNLLRTLFGNEAYLLPYQLTSALVNEAEGNQQLLDTLVKQFRQLFLAGKLRPNSFGFSTLPDEDQARLKKLFKQKGFSNLI